MYDDDRRQLQGWSDIIFISLVFTFNIQDPLQYTHWEIDMQFIYIYIKFINYTKYPRNNFLLNESKLYSYNENIYFISIYVG